MAKRSLPRVSAIPLLVILAGMMIAGAVKAYDASMADHWGEMGAWTLIAAASAFVFSLLLVDG